MSNICEKLIDACISADCNDPLYAGVDSVGYIANFADIASVTYDTTNPSIITGITMATVGQDTKCFYTIQQLGNQPFDGSQVEMTGGTYGNKFNNTVKFAVLDNGPEITNDIIDKLANGKFVVILKNDYKGAGGNAKYSVYGIKKGLKAASITRELYGDNESAWICSMTETNTPMSGLFFYVTDESTTDAAIDALKCTC